MGRLGLPLAMLVVLLGGCAPRGEPVAKPQAKPVVDRLGRRLRDDFDLPLVIQIDAPEVPPEIQNPSPPIEEQPNPP